MNQKARTPRSKKLFFFSGPTEAGAPDKLEDIVIQFIDDSRHRLFIAVQELSSLPITGAIIRARQRKVCLKIVLEQDYLC